MEYSLDSLSAYLLQQFRTLLTFFVAVPNFYMVYHYAPLKEIFKFGKATFSVVYQTLSYFNTVWVNILI